MHKLLLFAWLSRHESCSVSVGLHGLILLEGRAAHLIDLVTLRVSEVVLGRISDVGSRRNTTTGAWSCFHNDGLVWGLGVEHFSRVWLADKLDSFSALGLETIDLQVLLAGEFLAKDGLVAGTLAVAM